MDTAATSEKRPGPSPRERGIDRLARYGTAALFGLAATWYLVILITPDTRLPGRFLDARDIYLAGHSVLQGVDPYQSADYRNWPLVAVLAVPLGALPLSLGTRLFALGSAVLAAVGMLRLYLRLDGWRERPSWQWLCVVALSPAPLVLFFMGQLSGLCFGAFALGLSLMRRHPVLAGVCLALSAAKPQLGLIALVAVIAAEWATIVAFVGGVLCWPIGSAIVAGPGRLWEYVTRLYAVRDSTIGLVTPTLSSLVPITGPLHTVIQVLCGAAFGTILLALTYRRVVTHRLPNPSEIDVATAIALTLLPYALVSDLLFLTPLLLRLGCRPTGAARWILAGWWLLTLLAAITATRGGGGLVALLAPLAAIAFARSANVDRATAAPMGIPEIAQPDVDASVQKMIRT